MNQFSFRRGFIAQKGPWLNLNAIPPTWEKTIVSSWRVAHDPILPCSHAAKGTIQVMVLGYIIHVHTGATENEVADELAQRRGLSLDDYQKYLDSCAGRYAVLCWVGSDLFVQQDAVGLRAVYFAEKDYGRAIVASHDRLIAKFLNAPRSAFAKDGFIAENSLIIGPGNSTLFAGISRMTPNLELHANAGVFRRIYPRKPWKLIEQEKAEKLLEKVVDTQLDWWLSDSSPFSSVNMSVSGGFGSRAALAVTRKYVDRMRFFTYIVENQNAYSSKDEQNTAELIEHVHLNHTYLPLAGVRASQELLEAITINTDFPHSSQILAVYLDHFEPDALHIRSNAFEIVRGHYRKIGFNNDSAPASVMNYITYSGRCKSAFAIEEFHLWREKAKWSVIESLGYDPLDFLYWEHRMGAWLTPVLHESDIALDTAVLINCRELIDVMLALPYEDRKFSTVFSKAIRDNWPELAEVKINGFWLDESPNGAYH